MTFLETMMMSVFQVLLFSIERKERKERKKEEGRKKKKQSSRKDFT